MGDLKCKVCGSREPCRDPNTCRQLEIPVFLRRDATATVTGASYDAGAPTTYLAERRRPWDQPKSMTDEEYATWNAQRAAEKRAKYEGIKDYLHALNEDKKREREARALRTGGTHKV